MCKKVIYLFSVVLVLSAAGNTSAELVAYWNLNEGSGITAADSVGGYNGTLRGGPTWVKGVLGGALMFDGSDDCVEVGSYPVFNSPTGSFSVALWANISTSATVAPVTARNTFLVMTDLLK